jgi:glyoxylase-like metal-dependent hydrolase (beta-lactamase superfamily II)
MLEQVAPSIYCIPIPLPNNPLKSLNAYLVKGPRNLLIDTGFRQADCRRAMDEALRELGVSMDNTDIFLTHLHSDHSGLAPELAGPSTKIFLSAYDRTRLPGKLCQLNWNDNDAFFRSHGFPGDELRAVGQRNPGREYVPVAYDDYILVEEGDRFAYGPYEFEAIATPGHTPGHMCLFDRASGVMVLGDHVLFDITPNITTWINFPNSLGAYLDSLHKIAQYPVRVPLPAHRAVHEDFRTRIDQLLEHHQRRCQEVLDILTAQDGLTAYQVASRMTWRIRCNGWDDFPLAQKWFAVGEAIAHLEYLEATGRAVRHTVDDQHRFSVTTN